MEKDAEKFLQAEETAMELVETLKQLHNEATSYKTATKELDTVRQRLLDLIESTEKITSGSHEIIKILKEIGGAEILNRITKVGDKVSEEFVKLSKTLAGLKTDIIDGFTKTETKSSEEFAKQSKTLAGLKTDIIDGFTKRGTKSSEEFAKQSNVMNKLKILIVVTLASSVTAVIIGVIALLR